MAGGIFLIEQGGGLAEMLPGPYESEDNIQALLAQYPSLLAGDQIDPDAPRRWLLIAREMPVPGEKDGGGRWSLDHLFIDQDAIPTLVEVKQRSDTRIRREVVGQLLDYAANAVVHWSEGHMRDCFLARCAKDLVDPDAALLGHLGGPEVDPELFWKKAFENLRHGIVRILFVADEIPSELRRVVEFLNEQMRDTEVLAVEIRRYVGGGHQSIVPRVFGHSLGAQQRRSSQEPARQWNEELFLRELGEQTGPENVAVAQALLQWATQSSARIDYGKGRQSGSFFITFDHKGTTMWPIGLWTYGKLEVQFQWLRNNPAFADSARRLELCRRLNAIRGVKIPEDAIERRPNVLLSVFRDAQAMKQLLEILDWTREQLQAT